MFLSSTTFIYTFYDNYFIVSEKYLNNTIKGELNEEINKSIIKDIQANKISFEDIANYNYSNDGKISTIIIDSKKLNMMAHSVTISIQNIVEESENKFGIPIANIMGAKLFAGKGPKLSLTINKGGAVNYKIDSQLISGGINQTIHRITLTFNTVINCTAPFQNLSFEIENKIIVSETMIVGETPQIILPPG